MLEKITLIDESDQGWKVFRLPCGHKLTVWGDENYPEDDCYCYYGRIYTAEVFQAPSPRGWQWVIEFSH